jgi:hypothetical protein
MATVASLIEQLKEHDPNEPILFQYMIADWTSYLPEEFEEISSYLMSNDQFGDDTSELFSSWMSEASGIIEEQEEEEDND